MTEIKICGITNIDDGLAAATAGVDALGFVFHPSSSRYVTPEQARDIVGVLPPAICTVGVFVNLAAEEVLRTAEFCRLDFVQLHGGEPGEYCRRFPRDRVIKSLSFQRDEELNAMADYPVRAFLVDAHDPLRYGGTGKTCDWNLARKAAARYPLILAGGLSSENILAALEAVRPSAVDISSGVESAPGRKDREKIRSVVAAVKYFGRLGKADADKRIFKKL
jgi:phosphoribosylanthranilate isomerase